MAAIDPLPGAQLMSEKVSGSPAAPPKSTPGKIENAAKQFESLLIAQILKSMHESGSAGWLGTGDDQSGESAMELAEEQFAQALASRGGLGLSRLIMQGLTARSKSDPSHAEAPPKPGSQP
jgi:Rod binding domain-containing protein